MFFLSTSKKWWIEWMISSSTCRIFFTPASLKIGEYHTWWPVRFMDSWKWNGFFVLTRCFPRKFIRCDSFVGFLVGYRSNTSEWFSKNCGECEVLYLNFAESSFWTPGCHWLQVGGFLILPTLLGNDDISPQQMGMFESMIFRNSQAGICDVSSLENPPIPTTFRDGILLIDQPGSHSGMELGSCFS